MKVKGNRKPRVALSQLAILFTLSIFTCGGENLTSAAEISTPVAQDTLEGWTARMFRVENVLDTHRLLLAVSSSNPPIEAMQIPVDDHGFDGLIHGGSRLDLAYSAVGDILVLFQARFGGDGDRTENRLQIYRCRTGKLELLSDENLSYVSLMILDQELRFIQGYQEYCLCDVCDSGEAADQDDIFWIPMIIHVDHSTVVRRCLLTPEDKKILLDQVDERIRLIQQSGDGLTGFAYSIKHEMERACQQTDMTTGLNPNPSTLRPVELLTLKQPGLWEVVAQHRGEYLRFVDTVPNLTIDEMIRWLNVYAGELSPGIANPRLKGGTVHVDVIDSEMLTQRMGSSGARWYLAMVTASLTSLPGIYAVHFHFEWGDHAWPGRYMRKDFPELWGLEKLPPNN